ncbi:MAG: putative Ig domain-containing protein [Acidobacteria bacterium]|nr:putative Ig domain-containing protein [Acidobacteriota bacterium]MBI3425314.1 putative Ig domain-containing protein [Acidobacteriota bacterium]
MKPTNKSARKQKKANGKLRGLALLVLLMAVGVVIWQASKPMLAASSMAAAVESSRLSLDTAVEVYRDNRTSANWQAVEAARQVYQTAFTEAVKVNAVSPAPVMAASAALQLQTLAAIKKSLTPNQKKISSRLLFAARKQRVQLPLELNSMRTSVPTSASGDTLVDITVINRTAGLKVLDKFSFKVVNASPAGRVIVAEVPLGKLEELAAFPEIIAIREHAKAYTSRYVPSGAEAQTLVKPSFEKRAEALRNRVSAALAGMVSNVSEGDKTHRALDARGFFGVNGSGVKVGVISDGVDSLAALQASGDLPAVTVLDAGSGDEGSAMLEIVHDLAPNAQLYFATADPTQATFAANIIALKNAGCNIIVDDVVYLAESPLQESIVADAVNQVTAAGVLYFSSAGNEGNKNDGTSGTWEGNFNPNGTPPALAGGGAANNFGDGGQSILVTADSAVVPLYWSDVFGVSANDYDLYDMDGGLTTIFDASTDTQDGVGGDDFPVEISGPAFSGERLVVLQFAGANRFISLHNFRGRLDPTLSTTGSTIGHSIAVNAFSVAATPASAGFGVGQPSGPFPNPFTTANVTETFTSDGPRRIFFDFAGNLLPGAPPGNFSATGGIVRQKPDITAADGVMCAAPGFNPFFGTSAAAPHAAAIAALLKSAGPFTNAQIRTALISSALDIETVGVDRDSGAGIVMAYQALQAIGATPQAFLSLGTVAFTETGGDNDGFAESCEQLNYTIGLTNAGGATATGISATLTSATPGVVINQGVSAYPNLAVAASANNTTPFTVTIGCGVTCGATINFTLTVTFSGGMSPQIFNFSTAMGAPGTPITFSFTGPPVAIPDAADLSGSNPGAPVNANLVVAGVPGNIFDINFRFDGTSCTNAIGSTTVGLDHTFVNDLRLTLRAPDNTTVVVINNTDGSGNNFCQTLLDDESAGASIQSVVSGNAPFTGSFKPNAPLSGFDAHGANGTWQLQAQDFFSGDTGNIRAFSLVITPAVCATAACSLTQANIMVIPVSPGTTAVVNYSPSITGGCGVVTCVPPSGSTFPAGVTPVTCTPQAGSPINFTVTVGCAPITLGPLSGAVAGTPYNQSAVASPAGSYTYSVMSGSLPTGLTLNAATGAVTGTPTVAGTFTFTLKAADNVNPCMGTRNYTVVITCPTVTLAPTTLPNATVNVAYPTTLTGSPAGGNYTFAVTSGLLPAGLTLNANGSFSGAPTQSGVFNFRVTAAGFGGCTGFLDYALVVICQTVTLSPASLPSGTAGTAYSQSVSASPAGAYTYAVTSGSLPAGLTLNGATGALTGTPTTTGSFSCTLTASAGACSGSQNYTVTIGCPTITLSPGSLAAGQAGVAYSQTLSVSPAGSYTFSLIAGSLPAGLTLNASTGVISGIATATGAATFTVKAQAATGCAATQNYMLVIGCPTITVNPATLPSGTTGTAYSQVISAAPAGGNYSYAVTSGSLPLGLSLNAATGLLSGAPTTNGSYTFTVTATGFGGCQGSRSYSLVIGGACPTITLPGSLPNGSIGQLYSNTVAAAPAGSYTYALTGSLPPGVTFFNAAALLYGYPLAAGSYTFTITATQGACTGSQSYTVLVGAGAFAARAQVADYDGDGKADLALWRPANGSWNMRMSSTQLTQTMSWGTTGDLPLLGDYDGDGKTDLAVYRPSAGTFYVRRSSDGGYLIRQWGVSTDVPVPGDYDGDGKTDCAIWRPSEGNWYVLRSSDGNIDVVNWGMGDAPYLDVPVPGDYDGDGKTDLAVFRRASGTWLVKRSSDSQFIIKQWGLGTDVPVAADYDGDGKTDIAVWRQGVWYIWQSVSNRYRLENWGTSAAPYYDQALPSDYDGDKQADVAVWRASDRTWYVRCSHDGSLMMQAQGQAGDVPVARRTP